ncbi:MAG: aminotransferase class IV [Spirochaetia bacterium]|nr:aminotransferase class IV [Spirochaetia bacterium]
MDREPESSFTCAVRNLDIISLQDAVLPISNKEVFFNFSVYESIKIIDSTAVFLEDHLDRLFESAARLEIAHSLTQADVAGMASRLLETDRISCASLRVQLIGGSEPTLFIFPQQLPRYSEVMYREGVSVIAYRGERIMPEVKSNSLLLNYLAQREAGRHHALEALLITSGGLAVEGSRSNFFAVEGNRLITPGSGVLAGVTRKYILESAGRIGLDIIFTAPRVEDLYSGRFDEIFISSTSMGAMPVSQVDDCTFPHVFPITHTLHEMVGELEKAYIYEHASSRRHST